MMVNHFRDEKLHGLTYIHNGVKCKNRNRILLRKLGSRGLKENLRDIVSTPSQHWKIRNTLILPLNSFFCHSDCFWMPNWNSRIYPPVFHVSLTMTVWGQLKWKLGSVRKTPALIIGYKNGCVLAQFSIWGGVSSGQEDFFSLFFFFKWSVYWENDRCT